jgi:mono/diheme cytochrome c family protein
LKARLNKSKKKLKGKNKTVSKLKVLLIFLFIVFFIAACVQTKSKRSSGIVIAESKSYEASLYRQNCAICHGAEAYGKEIDGKLVPSLRSGDIEKKSEQEIYEQIAHGKLPMPAFKNQLSEEEIQKMVIFIRRDLQGKE